jgi:hypothetical protein
MGLPRASSMHRIGDNRTRLRYRRLRASGIGAGIWGRSAKKCSREVEPATVWRVWPSSTGVPFAAREPRGRGKMGRHRPPQYLFVLNQARRGLPRPSQACRTPVPCAPMGAACLISATISPRSLSRNWMEAALRSEGRMTGEKRDRYRGVSASFSTHQAAFATQPFGPAAFGRPVRRRSCPYSPVRPAIGSCRNGQKPPTQPPSNSETGSQP